MRYLPNAAQMKLADQYTIRQHAVSPLELMERAAKCCVSHMEEKQLDLSHVCIVCGTGNNGGDGFAIARMLALKGYNPTVVFPGDEAKCTDETLRQMELLRQNNVEISNTYVKKEYSVIVDAVFGVGLSRPIEGIYLQLIQDMNEAECTKVAVDIPSGVSADSGLILGIGFQADMTVTFQAIKAGMELYPGKMYSGEIFTADIGIDQKPLKEDRTTAFTYEKAEYRNLLPKRIPDSHKGSYGKALIIAGSKGMAGAAYLSAKAAYMTGAGLVRIYTPEDNRVILQQLLPEAIVTTYDFFDEGELFKLLQWADVVSIGSGIGTSEKSRKILKTTLENVEVPCVIDADGLNLIADHMKYMAKLCHEQFILTPHMKEMTRMMKTDMQSLRAERMEMLKRFVDEYGVTCVLKDARTVAVSAGRRPYINLSGNQAMAKAGSGDVLAGIITGLLAQGTSPRTAGILGVYLHGCAGDYARQEKGSYSVMAGDLTDYLGQVMKELERTYDEKI